MLRVTPDTPESVGELRACELIEYAESERAVCGAMAATGVVAASGSLGA